MLKWSQIIYGLLRIELFEYIYYTQEYINQKWGVVMVHVIY